MASASVGLAGPGETSFAASTNALRVQHALPGYRVCADLTSIARGWAAQMARAGALSHNGALAAQMPNWRGLGENVGEGANEPEVQRALVNSPPHLANLLSTTFSEVGYGTAVSANGTLYVDEVFRLPMSGSCGAGTATATAPAVPAPTKGHTAVGAPVPSSAPHAAGQQPARPSTHTENAASSAARAHSAPHTVTPRGGAATPLAPVDHSALAARRLAADLRRPAHQRDVVSAVFTFHHLLAGAVG